MGALFSSAIDLTWKGIWIGFGLALGVSTYFWIGIGVRAINAFIARLFA